MNKLSHAYILNRKCYKSKSMPTNYSLIDCLHKSALGSTTYTYMQILDRSRYFKTDLFIFSGVIFFVGEIVM